MRTTISSSRLLLSTALIASGMALCACFWIGAPSWNPQVLGRYSVTWCAGAAAANAVVGLATIACLRRMWIPRSPRARLCHRPSLTKKVIFSGITLLPVIVGLELVLRCFTVAPPRLWRPEAGTGLGFHALLQHADRIVQNGTMVRAYRGQNYELNKTAAVRIICLGGSTTWGHGLEREQTWPAMLERTLRDLGYDVEVINAGQPWYTSAHSVANYAVQMRYYNPDIVIVMHGVNDLARSFPAAGEPPPEWDYGSYQGPMRNVLAGYRAHNREGDWTAWTPIRLVRASALYRLVFQRALGNERPADVEVGLEAFPTLQSFRAHIEYLSRLCLYDNRKVVLATQGHIYDRPETEPGLHLKAAMRTTYMRTRAGHPISADSLRQGMREVRDITLEVAQRLGIPAADVEGAINGKAEYFMDDFHLTHAGNAVVAHTVLSVIRPLLGELQ